MPLIFSLRPLIQEIDALRREPSLLIKLEMMSDIVGLKMDVCPVCVCPVCVCVRVNLSVNRVPQT